MLILLSLALATLSQTGGAELEFATPAVRVLHKGGPPWKCVDIAILGDGYTRSEITRFSADARQVAGRILSTSPFDASLNRINIYQVNVLSRESGMDFVNHAKNGKTFPDRFVDTALDSSITRDRLVMAQDRRAVMKAADRAPAADFVLVIVNHSTWGGSAVMNVGAGTNASDFESLLLHELGHTLGNLGDEYDHDHGNERFAGPEPSAPNITTNPTLATLKWKQHLGKEAVSVFEGAGGYRYGIWRPTPSSCLMRTTHVGFWARKFALKPTFCRVCRIEGLSKTLSFFANSSSPKLSGTRSEEGDVTLTWSDPIVAESGFIIEYWSPDWEGWNFLSRVPTGTTSTGLAWHKPTLGAYYRLTPYRSLLKYDHFIAPSNAIVLTPNGFQTAKSPKRGAKP